MHKYVVMACLVLASTGCTSTKPEGIKSYKYAKAATFVEHKFNYTSDIVVYPTDYETALWIGNPYARLSGEWVITEWKTITVMEPRLVQGQQQLVETQVNVPIRKMEKIVYFDFDKAKLKKEATAVLKSLPIAEADGYVIDAHADAKGSDSYNQKLSEKRAQAVRKWLIAAGIPAEQISISAHGEKMPVASNMDKVGRAKNRRAVIHLNLKQTDAGMNKGAASAPVRSEQPGPEAKSPSAEMKSIPSKETAPGAVVPAQAMGNINEGS